MTQEGFKRKLTAILSADVVGYSRLMRDDEEATVRDIAAHRVLVTEIIQQHNGRVVDSPGDNILAEFASVVNAVNGAIKIQEKIKKSNTGIPEDRRMEFRVGINLGDVIEEEERIYGDGVNIAARVEGLAATGGIAISGTVYEHIKDKLSLGYHYLGEQDVKNIPEPVRVYRLLTEPDDAGKIIGEGKTKTMKWRWVTSGVIAFIILMAGSLTIWNYYFRTQIEPASLDKMAFPLPDKPSIAVLPFVNMSDDPKQEYFSDGITDDLITDLSKISGLFVIARNSVFTYKGKPVKIRQVAEEMGVRYVLEGSVRRARDRVRINAQLIDSTTDGHIWAERYDGKMDDVFALQDKITRQIVAVLTIKLTAAEEKQVARKETDSAEAYDAFLNGWAHYLRETPDNFVMAIQYLEKAIKLDPNYGKAYAALALTYWESWKRLWHFRLGLSHWHDARFQAEKFLKKAMQNPTTLAHQVTAMLFLHLKRHEEAIAEAELAITMDPNDANSYIALASALSLSGRPKEALQLVKDAMRLNPHYPSFYLYELGLSQFGMEQFDKAAVSLERATALNPDDRWSFRLLLATYGLLGRKEDAARVLKTIEHGVKRGRLNYYDPLTIRAITFWYPFRDPTDTQRLVEGLRKAGLPD
ncbi:MAG: adenylate/guanylate cyclase domain-containing protein [Nitrospinales bacterium]